MNCPNENCQASIPDGVDFCPSCGAFVDWDEFHAGGGRSASQATATAVMAPPRGDMTALVGDRQEFVTLRLMRSAHALQWK